MNTTLSILLLTIVCEAAVAQVVDAKATAEVLHLLRQYDQAWQNRDTLGVTALLLGDYLYFTSRGGRSSKEESINTLASPDYVLESAERSEIEVRIAGRTAIVSSRWRGRGAWKDKPFVDDQRCSLVFVKLDSTWKLLAEHCTQIQQTSE